LELRKPQGFNTGCKKATACALRQIHTYYVTVMVTVVFRLFFVFFKSSDLRIHVSPSIQ
jgi:hypothetical protein